MPRNQQFEMQSGKTFMSLAVNEMDQDNAPPRRTNRRTQPGRSAANTQRSRPPRDPDLDNEPDDIPFRSTIRKDTLQSRLNRRVF